MVAGGRYISGSSLVVLDNVEIIDIESTRSSCSFSSLPMHSFGLLGFFDFNENAVVCGGHDGSTPYKYNI